MLIEHHSKGINKVIVNAQSIYHRSEIDHLELRPLSSITKEDAKEIIALEGHNINPSENDVKYLKRLFNDQEDYEADNGRFSTSVHAVDLLRKKGFALPYLGIPVDQWVDYRDWETVSRHDVSQSRYQQQDQQAL